MPYTLCRLSPFIKTGIDHQSLKQICQLNLYSLQSLGYSIFSGIYVVKKPRVHTVYTDLQYGHN